MMDEYITRNNAISAACFGCNQQFSNEPCEPSECAIRQSIMALTTADVAPRAEVDRLERLRAELSKEVADLQDAIKCEKETNDHLCEEYMSAMREVEAMQRSFGEKLEVAEALIATLNKTTHNARQEVAREIFDEIENRLLPSNTSGEFRGDSIEWFDYYDLHLAEDIAELKKKYQIESTEL